MNKDKFITKVVFRKFQDGQILALFPYDKSNNYCNSYMHIGQHSDADYDLCIRTTKPARETEYKDLFNELETIGYNLQVIRKRS